MDVTIRQATPGDLAALLQFQQGVVEAERPFDPTLKDGSIHYYDIAALIASTDVHFLVAECGSDLVGCGFARIEAAKHYLRHPMHAYLGLMYVDPTHRGQDSDSSRTGRKCRPRGYTTGHRGRNPTVQEYMQAGGSKADDPCAFWEEVEGE